MRVDFNVPIEGGRITDDSRIVKAIDSIRSVTDRGGKLVLMSHLGRPKGNPNAEFSLKPVSAHLSTLLKKPIAFAEDCIGAKADAVVSALKPGDVALLENLRFHAGEDLIDKAKENPDKKPTPEQQAKIDALAAGLVKHADIYCNDAFGTCHRRHVSMYDVPMRLGAGKRVCGLLVQKELKFLGEALAKPERPFVAILGGAKVSDKIKVIVNLLPKVDFILIGGAMAYTFFAALGHKIGKSLCEHDRLALATELLNKAGAKIRLPVDSICASEISGTAKTVTADADIPDGVMGLDIGPRTIASFSDLIRSSKTVVWNGPMGVFETPPFDTGTKSIAKAMADATKAGAITIIGGGDSAAAVEACGLADEMTHISTGGGASLEFLEGKPFATIEILDDK
ncbi:MAG: phosphoglycerate kinase [Planctomycetes bacterium]|nr:phosphoglycerate kinase [Planctomycetota bacterium]